MMIAIWARLQDRLPSGTLRLLIAVALSLVVAGCAHAPDGHATRGFYLGAGGGWNSGAAR